MFAAKIALAAAALSSLAPISTFAASSNSSWELYNTISGNDFFEQFNWFTDKDPTGGLVLYQSQADAKAANLSYIDDSGKFVMAVDTVEQALEGRRSVRISSKNSFSDGVYVLNVSHVPLGCAVWPAFWTVTDNLADYPKGGEIDILENANDEWVGARPALHTATSCTIPAQSTDETGVVAFTNCSYYTPENTGCTVEMNGTSTPSWGTKFNAQGGGIVAMERSFGSDGHGVRVWYWSLGDEPDNLRAGSQSVDTSGWGTPGANFPVENECASDFGPHSITFDITLCGSLAGNRYNLTGCNEIYGPCSSQVAYNGSSFNQSYWAVHDLRLFTTGGGQANAAYSSNKSSGASSWLVVDFSLVALMALLAASAATVL